MMMIIRVMLVHYRDPYTITPAILWLAIEVL